MHIVDETPNDEAPTPAPAPTESGADSELDQLESDLDSVDSALRALDADELDEAETLTAALADETLADD